MPPKTPILFGKFTITSQVGAVLPACPRHVEADAGQVFHLTPLSIAFVNLKPLLPGHVLVSPRRVVPRLSDLSSEEVSDLFLTVQRVARMIEKTYDASAMNVALQDGVDAGQSVPHVHTHIIPRRRQDLEERGGNDAIYGMLEGEDGDVGRHLSERETDVEIGRERPKFPKVDDASRKPRTEEDMVKEADMLRGQMESERA